MPVVLAKGQLSYLILSCLEEKDMYGLELIDEIKKRSGVEIKLPSLYSNLNRMKELKYISSYLKESSKGPKCSYSSITEAGRNELANLRKTFETSESENKFEQSEEVNSGNDLKTTFDDYNEFFAEIPEENENNNEKINIAEKVDEPILSDNLQEEETTPISPIEKEKEEISEINILDDKNQKVIQPENSTQLSLLQESIPLKESEKQVKDDAVFLPKNESLASDEYNKKLFDVSKDYNKYKKRKSFSENQIEMVVNCTNPIEIQREKEKQAENISELKEALLQTRQGNYDEINFNLMNRYENKKEQEKEKISEEKLETQTEKPANDGKFITDRVEYNQSNSKRFEPSKFSFLNIQQETILPAPKRNTNLDPNCSDVKAKLESLYLKSQTEKSDDSQNEKSALNDEFESFEDLKEYYEDQNISFKIFRRTGKRTLHNTNKINFIVESIVFGIISLCSGLFYLLFSKLGLTNPNTNFIYYLCPILYFIYLMVKLYLLKKTVSKVPKPLFNFVVVIGSAILLSGVIFCLNLAFGMSINAIPQCSTTLFMPIIMVLIIFIVRHYILLFAYKKFWR